MDLQSVGDAVRHRVVDSNNPSSVASSFRRRRWNRLLERFPDLAQMSVLDLGGTVAHWETAPVRPASLTVLNLMEQPTDRTDVTVVVGDGCEPPAEITARHFDLVYSNSVLEHVGGHARRRLMAEVVTDLGDHHWVQTPNRYFPIEPHWLFPGFQFLPVSARVWLTEHWPFGYIRGSGPEALDEVLGTELVEAREMRHLFPDSTLVRERALLLTKSLIAVD